MLTDEILVRLLQFSTALGAVSLLITCMSMHEVKWWLPVPIYALAMSCLVTFLTTFFMRRYTFDLCVVTIFLLAISASMTALHSYIKPLPAGKQEARNRRILYWVLPVLGILLTVWCVGVTYEGGIGYFQRFERFFGKLLYNQERMMVRQDSTEVRLGNIEAVEDGQDSTSAAYRERLDQRLQAVDERLTNLSLRLHRLTTDTQKGKR